MKSSKTAAVVGLCAAALALLRRRRQHVRPPASSSLSTFRIPEPHFGGESHEQSGVPGTHSTHDATDDPVGRLCASDKARFERDGFVVIRGLLDSDDLAELRREMGSIIEAWPLEATAAPGEAPETPHVAFDLAVRTGQVPVPDAKADGVRRIFRMAVHSAFFARFCKDPRFVAFLQVLWGTEDIALIQSMALMKPPGTGEKRWHQDQGYFRLRPNHVAAYWIAVDETDYENGCMHVVPGEEKRTFLFQPTLPCLNPLPRDQGCLRKGMCLVWCNNFQSLLALRLPPPYTCYPTCHTRVAPEWGEPARCGRRH